MEFSRAWLAEYVELPDSPRELADRLTAAGLAVEGLEERGDDLLLDIDVTTNRPDCMSYLGLAREVAVLFGRDLRLPEPRLDEGGGAISEAARIEIEDPDCLRYAARVVRGVEVGPSPEWLVRRLETIGQRSINNIVDVTNFVLWESGQPIHAFDLGKLGGHRIVVRAARRGELLLTLDGEKRTLDPEVLVIADAERAVALAGIMGGLDSEVTAATRDVLIESAHFDPSRVRRGANRLGLHSDASHRFERGADPEACLEAANRVAELIVEVAGGQVLEGALDVRAAERETLVGVVRPERLSAFAGIEFAPDFVERTFAALGFDPRRRNDGSFELTVPSWRWYDFAARKASGEVYEADLYEEAMRIHGFDAIPAALPAIDAPDEGASLEHRLREKVRRYLAASGLAEAINFAFYADEADRLYPGLVGGGQPVRLANPLSEKLAVMRRSLLPGLVETARFNQRRGVDEVRLFEIGRLFPGDGSAEVEAVALVAGGSARTPWHRRRDPDLFDLKGILEGLAGLFGVRLEAVMADLPGLIAGTSCRLAAGGEEVGYLGRLDDDDFPFPVYAGEIATAPFAGGAGWGRVRLPSRFPGIATDLTLTHALEVRWRDLEAAIREFGARDLVSFGLKDRYQGEGVPSEAVNTTISFLYNAEDRSLTQEEVNATHQGLTDELERRFGWSG